MPDVGVGTFELTKKLTPQAAEDLLTSFLVHRSNELSLIDTAPVYDTEELIGKAISRAFESGVRRENIVIQTKVSNDNQGYDSTLKLFEESLQKLGLDNRRVKLPSVTLEKYHR